MRYIVGYIGVYIVGPVVVSGIYIYIERERERDMHIPGILTGFMCVRPNLPWHVCAQVICGTSLG